MEKLEKEIKDTAACCYQDMICDVRVWTHVFETCDVRACGAFFRLVMCDRKFARFSAIL